MKNLVFITGRLTADSSIQYFESGKVKTTFSIAVDSYMNKEKFTTFIPCSIWDKQAEFAAEYFKKGKTVSVFGELISREYEGKTYYTVNCKTANFVSSQIVVKGIIDDIDDKTIYINIGEGERIKAECFIKDLKVDEEKSFVLNLGFKDKKPVYSVVSIGD